PVARHLPVACNRDPTTPSTVLEASGRERHPGRRAMVADMQSPGASRDAAYRLFYAMHALACRQWSTHWRRQSMFRTRARTRSHPRRISTHHTLADDLKIAWGPICVDDAEGGAFREALRMPPPDLRGPRHP